MIYTRCGLVSSFNKTEHLLFVNGYWFIIQIFRNSDEFLWFLQNITVDEFCYTIVDNLVGVYRVEPAYK